MEHGICVERTRHYERALKIAAEHSYQMEIIDTDMETFTIGEGNEFVDKEDWLECKIGEWLSEAVEEKGE